MTNLATPRPDHPSCLADAEGWEVVVQHEGLAALALDGIDDLRIAGGAQRGGHDGLGLAAGEQRRAMGARQELHATRYVPHHRRAAPVDAALSRDDGAAHDRLLELLERLAHLRLRPGVVLLAGQRLDRRGADLAHPSTTLDLVDDPIRLRDAGLGGRTDRLVESIVGGGRLPVPLRPARLRGERLDCVDGGLHPRVTEHHRIEHHRLGQHLCFRFDHQHRSLRSGDDEIQLRRRGLLEGGIENELSADVADARRAHRTVERETGHRERSRRADECGDVRVDVGVERQDGGDHLHLVAEAGREQRTQRAIDEPRGQRLLLGRPSFALEEAAGDLPRGIRLLDVVHGQRKEIPARLRRTRSDDRRQHRGIPKACKYRTGCLASDLAGFQHEVAGTERNRLLHGCHWLNLARRSARAGREAHVRGGDMGRYGSAGDVIIGRW